jgi:SAM-dependent methyltransferase
MVERIVPDEPSWAEHSAPHVGRYLAAAEYGRGRRILDAGCGIGYGARLLVTGGAAEVTGVDADPDAVRQAQERFGGERVTFLVDDCQELAKIAGPLDLICALEVIEHLPRPERFLERARQLLAADGTLLVSTPDRAATPPQVGGRPRNRFHFHEWHAEEFQKMLTAYFSRVELRAQVRSIALESRLEAVQALREGLLWSNPLLVFLWRKLPGVPKRQRAWKKLAGLAAPTIADYPIVPLAVAPLYGTPWCHFAICSGPNLVPLGIR